MLPAQLDYIQMITEKNKYYMRNPHRLKANICCWRIRGGGDAPAGSRPDPLGQGVLCSVAQTTLRVTWIEIRDLWIGGTLIINTAAAAAAKSLQSCPTLCDPTDGSLPGSPIPGILQARVLEWGATAFSDSLVYYLLKKFQFLQYQPC